MYEREAIEKHIKKMEGRQLKLLSPITRQEIGKKLIVAKQIQNTIETLIDNGAIDGDLAKEWKARKKQNELIEKANQGDASAMLHVGLAHFGGQNGFPEDNNIAYSWFLKAHSAGNEHGTDWIGRCLLNGTGVAKDTTRGLAYTVEAATKGSSYAAAILRRAYTRGRHGLPIDHGEADRWRDKV